jgi:hypothetical protein
MGSRPGHWAAIYLDEVLLYQEGRKQVTSGRPLWLR